MRFDCEIFIKKKSWSWQTLKKLKLLKILFREGADRIWLKLVWDTWDHPWTIPDLSFLWQFCSTHDDFKRTVRPILWKLGVITDGQSDNNFFNERIFLKRLHFWELKLTRIRLWNVLNFWKSFRKIPTLLISLFTSGRDPNPFPYETIQ